MASILFVVTNHGDLGNTGRKTGWYLPEVAHPYHTFKNAGFEMTLCSPKGGLAPVDPSSLEAFKDDEQCQQFLADEDAQNKIKNTVSIAEIDPSKFSCIFYAGGHGPMFDCADNVALHQATAKIYENGGIVSAVCHGTVGLANVKLSNGDYLVKGKSVTCFTNDEEEAVKLCEAMPFLLETRLIENGAKFEKKENWAANVVVCDRIATGQNPASASPLAEAMVKLINAKA